jgi:large subunit ribosomal protein L24e
MIVDSSLLLSQFQKRRNIPVKYDRHLVQATVKAMKRVEEIRARRERVFTRRRLVVKERERRRKEDLRTVATGSHLLPKEIRERDSLVEAVEKVKIKGRRVLGEERIRGKQKARRKLLVGGGTEVEGEEEMDVD